MKRPRGSRPPGQDGRYVRGEILEVVCEEEKAGRPRAPLVELLSQRLSDYEPQQLLSRSAPVPLHDWAVTLGWPEVRTYWLTELARHIKPQLPDGFRARIVCASESDVEPDLVLPEPDFSVTVAAIRQPELRVAITSNGRLVAAVELVSPRYKDRTAARRNYGGKYVGYLRDLVQLLIVDVHPVYRDFSFADFIASELKLTGEPRLPAPFAISYRVVPAAKAGEPCLLEAWRRPLNVGAALPEIPLALDGDRAILIDLEGTYSRAAAESYLT